MITFKNVTKTYPDGTNAVSTVNFDIKKGEFFVIIGPSGSGKTTVLKMINRLHSLTKGDIYIQGKHINDHDIHELRWRIGYVLQEIALFPHMTIEENIAIVPELKKWPRQQIKQRIEELLDMVGLNPDEYAQKKPFELSGGQQQRIGVIRAIAANPDIVLMDEPFSALDPITREKLQEEIKSIQKSIQKTTVFVTHDMQEALKLADRICLMKDGEIVQIGTPNELMYEPKNQFVKNFVGNKDTSLMDKLQLDRLMLPLPPKEEVQPVKKISSTANFQEILEELKTKEQLIVEKDGVEIGLINRQSTIDYIANELQNGGNSDD